MTKRGKIMIVFFIGLLLMGIGSGVTFAEFTSFRYGGEKNFSGEMTKVTLQQSISEDAGTVYLLMRGFDLANVSVEQEDSMAPGRITVEVTCDGTTVTPYIEEAPEWTEESGETAYSVGYSYHSSSDELEDFLQVKEEVLKDIKDRTVYTYVTDYIQTVTIKAAPQTADRLVIR